MNRNELQQEYHKLDKKLTAFRKRWNARAFKDLEYVKKHRVSKGKQGDFPAWWYEDVERWRELRRQLGIK